MGAVGSKSLEWELQPSDKALQLLQPINNSMAANVHTSDGIACLHSVCLHGHIVPRNSTRSKPRP